MTRREGNIMAVGKNIKREKSEWGSNIFCNIEAVGKNIKWGKGTEISGMKIKN